MPIFIEIANLVIRKATVESKFSGGLERFREENRINDNNSRHDEDNLLFSIAYMGIDNIDIDRLVKEGFEFDFSNNFSNDFVIIGRYEGPLWKPDWFDNNASFFWHKEDRKELIEKAQEINKLNMDEISELFDRGVEVFNVLKD